jgi:outer membrane protein TolC
MNNFVATREVKVDVQRALAILALCPGLELDEQLKLSTLEGETGLNELVSSLLAENEDDEGMVKQIKAQIDDRRQRIERFERRIETRKNAIISLMDCARLTKLPLPEATVTLRTLGPRPRIVDEEALPPEFITETIVRRPDREAIDAALERGENVPGVVMSNGGSSLTVRRK